MSNLIRSFNFFIQQIERAFPVLFGKIPPSKSTKIPIKILRLNLIFFSADNFGILGVEPVQNVFSGKPSTFSLKDLIGDGFLWAVPKHRRTIEKRLNRKFGRPEYVWKLLKPKTTLRICVTCGNHHEVDTLCPHCYDKIRKETELIKEKIQESLGLNPVEQDVVVLYDGEKAQHPEEYWQGKRIVEMEKPRPSWFSKNLLQKTTQPNAESKEIKPNDLS